MEIRKIYIALGLILAFGIFCGIVAYAQDTTQAMTIRFSAPVQIPGKVLPAGTYQFKPAESDESVVRIFSGDGTHLYATLQTVTAERSITDEDLVMTVGALDSTNPSFLVKWFYPGNLIGRELVYSGEQQQQVTHMTSRTSVATQLPYGTPVDGN